MVVYYTENGKNKKAEGVLWVDILAEDGKIAFIKNCQEIEVPLQDVTHITEK